MWNVFKCCLLLLVSSASSASSKCTGLNRLDWLIGHWQSTPKASGNEETWRAVSPLTFEGKGNFFDKQGK